MAAKKEKLTELEQLARKLRLYALTHMTHLGNSSIPNVVRSGPRQAHEMREIMWKGHSLTIHCTYGDTERGPGWRMMHVSVRLTTPTSLPPDEIAEDVRRAFFPPEEEVLDPFKMMKLPAYVMARHFQAEARIRFEGEPPYKPQTPPADAKPIDKDAAVLNLAPATLFAIRAKALALRRAAFDSPMDQSKWPEGYTFAHWAKENLPKHRVHINFGNDMVTVICTWGDAKEKPGVRVMGLMLTQMDRVKGGPAPLNPKYAKWVCEAFFDEGETIIPAQANIFSAMYLSPVLVRYKGEPGYEKMAQGGFAA